MAGVVGGLRVNAAAMYAALVSGFSQSTDLAEFVMQECDVDYRTAYQVVGLAVRRAAQDGLRGGDLTGERLDAAAVEMEGRALGLTGRNLHEVLDPAAIVATRLTRGGGAPEVVRAMARDCQAAALASASVVAARRAQFDDDERALLEIAAAHATPTDTSPNDTADDTTHS